ncbi:MAG: MotA/TolQ/ExbB proton channel family protein [Phycisphaerales bacterium JB043]
MSGERIRIGTCVLGGLAISLVSGSALAQDSGETISMFEAFFIQKDQRTGSIEWLGTIVVWLLLMMSMSTFALLALFHRETRRKHIVPRASVVRLRKALKEEGPVAMEDVAATCDSTMCLALRAALREQDAGHDAMVRALEQACDELTAARLRRVEVLHIIGSVSPMIGLFGTVYGMILAFQEIVASGGTPDPVGLAAGIGTALTTTFWGLVVAIPALAGHAFLRNGIDALTAEAALEAEDLVNHFRPKDESAG